MKACFRMIGGRKVLPKSGDLLLRATDNSFLLISNKHGKCGLMIDGKPVKSTDADDIMEIVCAILSASTPPSAKIKPKIDRASTLLPSIRM